MKTNRVIETIGLVIATSITTALLLRLKDKFTDDGNDDHCGITKGTLQFEEGSPQVTARMGGLLDILAKQIRNSSPNCKVVVQGNGGTTRPTYQLSLDRTLNVVEYLYNIGKVNRSRLVIVIKDSEGENDIIYRATTIY